METNSISTGERSYFKPLIWIVLIGIAINLAAVNYVLYRQSTASARQPASPTSSPIVQQQPNCDEQCVRKIVSEATASIKLASPVTSTVPVATPKVTPALAARLKDVFVSIGSGSTAGGDWTFIETPAIPVSRSSYPTLSAAYFEATLSIPSTNGIAYARLFNVTDNVPLAYSDVSTTNSSPHLVTSLPITLEGTKTYRVQLKSSQSKDVILTQSRVKIVIN